MRKYNEENERIKRRYFHFEKEARGKNPKSIDKMMAAIVRFEQSTNFKSFKAFHIEQPIRFKKVLEEGKNPRTKRAYSQATISSTLRAVKAFFIWLAGQPGYKSRISYADAEYFNASHKTEAIAHARRDPRYPSIDQAIHTFRQMPSVTELERRDRAIFAFFMMTGARDGAAISFQLRHVDLIEGSVYQDARQVKTKGAKTFKTSFFPVAPEYELCFREWVTYLRKTKLYGPADPLFPKTKVGVGASRKFEALGLDRKPWASTESIRKIIKAAFAQADIEPFGPHSIRHTLAKLGETVTGNLEEFKAWSLNLGHSHMGTTLTSYGGVSWDRQAKIIRSLKNKHGPDQGRAENSLNDKMH